VTLPGKRPDLLVHERKPLNAETPRAVLGAASLTPTEAFFVRDHGPVPDAGSDWHVEVAGLVDVPLTLGLDDLRDGPFPRREVTATLQCAGNRRAALLAVADVPGEAPWGPGATGTAVWGGVALADVLSAALPQAAAAHVAAVGADRSQEARPPQPFGASIPLRKALGDEVLLAWEMNGAPLPAAHGAPVRLVVPGWIGARSVKWLRRIELCERPFDGWFQDVAYRLLAPDEAPGPGVGVALGEVALNADVLVPADGATVGPGPFEVRGYAHAGGDRTVARVDVSADGGRSWRQAELLEDLGRWAWRLWRAELALVAGEHELVVRAWDSAAATQPESPAAVWNPKGYVNNAWGRVTVRVAP
jgi:sulfite oxidase